MPHMTIMRGGPGSGKSTIAKTIAPLHESIVCSADDFFINEKGDYDFDPAWLGRAHGACLKKCVEAIMQRRSVVIDNTNGSPDSMIPYLALCQAFGYTCEVVKVNCDREVAWGRQTHGAPRDVFDRIFDVIERTDIPGMYRDSPWLSYREVGRPSCNCGVSSGIRGDHESQCRATYLRRP